MSKSANEARAMVPNLALSPPRKMLTWSTTVAANSLQSDLFYSIINLFNAYESKVNLREAWVELAALALRAAEDLEAKEPKP